MMDFIGFIFVCLALILVSKLIGSVKSTSPEERYFKIFGVPFDAKGEETEKAFQSVFIREKQPYAAIYRQLLPFAGRKELSKEEKEIKAKLRKDLTKVLKNLKELYDLALNFKPEEAKKVAEDLHIDQLIVLLGKSEAELSVASS